MVRHRAIAKLFRLDPAAELVSTRELFQMTLDKASTEMLLIMLDRPDSDETYQPMRVLLRSDLEAFLDNAD